MTPWVVLSSRPVFSLSDLNSPGQNAGVGSLFFLQGIFPTQGSNPGLSHCRQILYQLSHQESPRILELVAYPFSRGSSQPRNRTKVSCIVSGFFTIWATREAWDNLGMLIITLPSSPITGIVNEIWSSLFFFFFCSLGGHKWVQLKDHSSWSTKGSHHQSFPKRIS